MCQGDGWGEYRKFISVSNDRAYIQLEVLKMDVIFIVMSNTFKKHMNIEIKVENIARDIKYI